MNRSLIIPIDDTSIISKAKKQHNRARSAVIQSRLKTGASDTISENSEFKKKPFMISSVKSKRKTSPNNIIKEYHENVISKIKLKKHNSAERFLKKPWIITSIQSKRKVSSKNENGEFEVGEDDEIMMNDNSIHRITITKIEKQADFNKTFGIKKNDDVEHLLPSYDNELLNEKIEKKLKKLEKDLTKVIGGKPYISEEIEYRVNSNNDGDKE
jgi:hypothetical protein